MHATRNLRDHKIVEIGKHVADRNKMEGTMRGLRYWMSALAICSVSPVAGAEAVQSFIIDFSKPDAAKQQAEALQAALSQPAETITLKLVIIPEMIDDKPNYNVKRIPAKSTLRKAVRCDSGWERFGSATSAFDIEFGVINPHLLLTIRHASAAQAPFHTAACEYIPAGPDAAQLVFKGTYAKSEIAVPTAMDMELRPVDPR
jgi:hypothetical protein